MHMGRFRQAIEVGNTMSRLRALEEVRVISTASARHNSAGLLRTDGAPLDSSLGSCLTLRSCTRKRGNCVEYGLDTTVGRTLLAQVSSKTIGQTKLTIVIY